MTPSDCLLDSVLEMSSLHNRTSLSSMSVKELFSAWWSERWVRALVISLSPLGLMDALFTIHLSQKYGVELEYNPMVRLALTSDWWIVWLAVNTVSFSVFAMIIGSYYLHTRGNTFGKGMQWIAALVGFRVGLLFHSIFMYYGVSQSIFWGIMSMLLSFFLLDSLLSREKDISWSGFIWFWRAKFNRLHDWKLTRGNVKPKRTMDSKEQPIEQISISRGILLRKVGYISLALLIFVSVPFILSIVSVLMGGPSWSKASGSGFYWSEPTGRILVGGFFVTLVMFSFIMYFMLDAFGASEDQW